MNAFTITRETWARGGENGPSALLNDQWTMCRLGHFCKNLGAPDELILDIPSPHGLIHALWEHSKPWREWSEKLKELVRTSRYSNGDAIPRYGTPFAYELMETNDTSGLSDSEREKHLKALFLELGWQVEFVD